MKFSSGGEDREVALSFSRWNRLCCLLVIDETRNCGQFLGNNVNKRIESENSRTISLLILERGAEWPSWGAELRARSANSAVEVQNEHETMADFHARVHERLVRIRRDGMSVQSAGIACSLLPSNARSLRAELCVRLSDEMKSQEGAELIIAGGSWETTGLEGFERTRLIELWSELSHRTGGCMVSVRFEDPPYESGVFRAAERLQSPNPVDGGKLSA